MTTKLRSLLRSIEQRPRHFWLRTRAKDANGVIPNGGLGAGRRRAFLAFLLVALGVGCAEAKPDSTIDKSTIDDANAQTQDAAAALSCNGDPRLCARRLDEITLPGAHNAMSSKAEGWAFPNQDVAFDTLLDSGIRALLMDVHSWSDPEGDGTKAPLLLPRQLPAGRDAL